MVRVLGAKAQSRIKRKLPGVFKNGFINFVNSTIVDDWGF